MSELGLRSFTNQEEEFLAKPFSSETEPVTIYK